MKKLALILALLLAAGGFAVAELEPTVTGEAAIAFGYDLDAETWGFDNTSDSSLTLTLVSGSVEKMGEGAWYGVLELSDFAIDFDDAGTHYELMAEDGDDDEITLVYGTVLSDATPDEVFVNIPVSITVPTVTAKITDGNLYFQFCSAPDFDADYVAEIEDDDAIDFDNGSSDDIAGGFEVGGAFGPATVAVSFGTYSNFDSATQDNTFALEGVVGLDLAPIQIDLAVATGFGDTSLDTGVAAQVEADIAPLTITAAADYETGGETFEVSAGISADVSPLTVGVDVYYEDDVDVALAIDADVAPLTVGVDVELLNAIDALAWTVDADVAFAASEDITVNAAFGMGSDDIISASASVVMTGIIDPMTFTLAWEDGDDLTGVSADDQDLGQVVFYAEISY